MPIISGGFGYEFWGIRAKGFKYGFNFGECLEMLIYMVLSLQLIMIIIHRLVCDCVETKMVGTESPQNPNLDGI